jgi:transposase
MNSMSPTAVTSNVIVGVDTHKHVHVAVAIDESGQRLSEHRIPVDTVGYQDLERWAKSLGRVAAFGVEGTGSYGVGLASYLRRHGLKVVEVNRGDRRARRANGKSDTLDAELAARSVLAGTSTAVPKSADGVVEMIRQIKVARDIATKGRTSAIITLKTIVVNAPSEMREQLDHLTDKTLIEKCAGFRPGKVTEAISSTKHTLRSLAKRWQFLDAEVKDHDRILDELTQRVPPTLREGFGIGPDTAAELLIVLGDNPDRVRSEACFAKLCGVAPIPASSGMTNRHRLAWNGHRQANAALYRVAILRMQHHEPTKAYVARRTEEGLSKRDIIRCLKRFIAREAFGRIMTDFRARAGVQDAAITQS